MRSHLRSWNQGVVYFDAEWPPSVIVNFQNGVSPKERYASAIRAAMPEVDSVLLGPPNLLVVRTRDYANVEVHIERLVQLLTGVVNEVL